MPLLDAPSISKTSKDVDEAMVIGGASLYAQTLPLAQRLYMTLVHANIKGDAWFPEFALNEWREIQRQEQAADDKNPYACTFVILERTV